MEPIKLFSKCIIKPSQQSIKNDILELKDDDENIVVEEENINDKINNEELDQNEVVSETINDNLVDKDNEINEDILVEEAIEKSSTNDLGDNNELTVETNTLEEIKLDSGILESEDVVQIKEANEVYYKMYKEAIKRARLARDLALSSFMEAKNIKNKYMLDEALIDSEDESDLEKELEEEEEE